MVNYHKTWRLINSGPCSASYNMAMDEAIAVSVREGNSIPTLRLYSWYMPSLSLGCFQRCRDIDIDFCMETGIPIVRRPTGGKAILHGRELTYSFSIRTDNEEFSKGIFDSYKKISSAFYLALSKLGLSPESKLVRETHHSLSLRRVRWGGSLVTRHSKSPLCFQSTSFGEVAINGRKIIGSAQKRWNDGLLQQGSIPYLADESLIKMIFRINPANDIKAATAGLLEAVPDLNDADFREKVRISFEEVFGVEFIPCLPSVEEESLALRLESEKYQSPEWTLRQ